LLEIAWWNWPAADVDAAVDLLASADIDAFIGWAAKPGRL